MSSRRGQQRRAPTSRTAGFLPEPRGSGRTNGVNQKSASSANVQSGEKSCGRPIENISERLHLARAELIHMEMQLETKEATISRLNNLLKQKESLVKQLQTNLVRHEKEREKQVEAQNAAETENAKLTRHIWDVYEVFDGMRQSLRTCGELEAEAAVYNRSARNKTDLFSVNMTEQVQRLQESSRRVASRMKSLKDSHVQLTRELQSCKEELEEKSQQYEAAESQRQTLQRGYSKLEEGFEQVTNEIENWRSKVWSLTGENSGLRRENTSLSRQVERGEEERTQFVSELRGLYSAVCKKDDFQDESAAMKAIGAAFNELTLDCNSLREKEAAAAKKAEELDAEKGLLATANCELTEKVKDYIQLQEAKQQLQTKLELERKAVKDMAGKFRDIYDKAQRDKEDLVSLASKMQAFHSKHLEQRKQLGDVTRRLNASASRMRNRTAAHVAERQQLQEECACQQSTIISLRADKKGLYDAISNFEQLAQSRAEDLAQAEEKNKSLEGALAAARKEIVEEREKAASLLLEKDTRTAQLETKLKGMEEWVAKLERKNAATADAAKVLREANEGLSSAMAGLVAELNLERERRENRTDCDSQTEGTLKADCDVQTQSAIMADCDVQTDGAPKVDCDVQTEDSAKVDADVQTENVTKVDCGTEVAEEASADVPSKVDCEAQTVGALYEDTAEKLASAQLEINRLNVAFQQLSVENESLRNNYTASERNFIGARNACSTLKQEVKELRKQMEASNKEKEEMKEGIHSLESLLTSKDGEVKEHLKASERASAALKAENEKLTTQVSELRNHMMNLHKRLLYKSSSMEMENRILKRQAGDKQEEMNFLKNEIAKLKNDLDADNKRFERQLRAKQEEVDSLRNEIAELKKDSDAAPPVHKVVASAQQKPAQVAAGKLAVVTSTPVTKPGEPVASTSKGPSPMVSPILHSLCSLKPAASASSTPATHAAKGSSCSTEKSEQAVKPLPSKGSKLSLQSHGNVKDARPSEKSHGTAKDARPSEKSHGTAKDARPSDKALAASPLKRTLGMDQDRVDHPVAAKKTAGTPPPTSSQSTAPQPVTKKRKFFKSSTGH